MKCPNCQKEMKRDDTFYAQVYVCEECGIVVLDFKLKLPIDRHNRVLTTTTVRGPTVKGKERSRTKKGRWRKVRSDRGRKRKNV